MSSILSYVYKMYKLLLIDSYEQEMKLKEMTLKPIELLLRVPSDDTCVFCGSSDELWDLYPQGNDAQNSMVEDYSLILQSCFNIKLVDPSGCGGLCGVCVVRLRDASSFRAQVEAAGTLFQQAEEKPCTIPDSPEHQSTIEDNPRPGQEKIEIEIEQLTDGDNLDTFWNDDTINIDEEEDQKQNLQELNDLERLEWSDQEPLKNNLKVKNKGVKRIEWRDQQQYPKPNTFTVVKLKPDSNDCPVCGEVFPKREKLRQHFEYHFPRFLCHLCGKVFAKKITYDSHLERHQAKSYPCLRCWNKSYATKNSLHQHEKTVHNNELLYSCPTCHIRFTSAHNRKEHLLKEHGIWTKQYICPECLLKCRSPSRLDEHVRKVHRNEKNINCPECGALFFGKKELQRHSLSHSDLRKYICDICSKAFKDRRHLQYHLAVHYNIRNHKCLLCDAAFVQTTSLKLHMKSRHKNVFSES